MKPMGKRGSDVLDVIMAQPVGDDEQAEGEADDGGDTAVMNFDHGDDESAESEPEEGTPEAKIADIRRGLDELEQMFH